MFGSRIVFAEDILMMPLGTRISVILPGQYYPMDYRLVRWGRSRKRLQKLEDESFYVCIRDYWGAEYRKKGDYYDV